MTWINQNLSYIGELMWGHLLLSIPPIVFAVLIAVPIGRLAFRFPKVAGPLLSGASLLYAIPALPLIIIIPLIFGTRLRSPLTIIIALTIYGVALLVRTAADAFTTIPATTKDAAIAIGNSPMSVFWKVELPLAIPVLIAGIRVVAVSTISLVTIGAVIGIPSLGSLLTDGFQREIGAAIAAGIISTMLLAILTDAILLAIGYWSTPWRNRKGVPTS